MDTTTPKNAPNTSLSPRLEGYLKRANSALADRTKTPMQHAAARRVKDAIEGLTNQPPRATKP